MHCLLGTYFVIVIVIVIVITDSLFCNLTKNALKIFKLE